MPNNDLDLIEKAKKGDKRAFGKIYEKFLPRIYRFVFYLVPDSAIAEDITQDTFVKSWESLAKFSGKKGTVQSYLYAIARNGVIDYQRKKKESRLNMDYAQQIGSDENLEDKVINLERVSKVHQALSDLSKEDRDLIVLRYFEEMSYKEIADIVGQSEGAVRVKTHRIVKSMKSFFSKKDL